MQHRQLPPYRIRESRTADRRSFDIVLTETNQCIRSQLSPYGEGEAEQLVRDFARGPLPAHDWAASHIGISRRGGPGRKSNAERAAIAARADEGIDDGEVEE